MRAWRSNVAMLLRLVWRVEPRMASAGFVTHVLAGLANPLAALLLGLLVDATIAREGTRMTALAVALALAWVAAIAGGNFGMWIVNGLQERMAIFVERDLIRLTTEIPDVEHHEHDAHLDQVALLREQRHRFSLVAFSLAELLAIVVQLAGSAVALAGVDLLLLLLPAFAIPNLLLTARAERMVHAARDRTAGGLRLANHLYEVATTPAAGKDMRLSGMGREIRHRHGEVWDGVSAEREAAQLRAALWRTLGVAVFAIGYVACVVYALARAAAGEASVGDVVLVLAIAAQLSNGLASGVDVVSWFAQQLRSFDRYAWLHERHADATRPGAATEPAPSTLREGLELRGVGFRYPGAARPALHALDLRIPPGTLVALVGENGSGKSTLVKLLCRLYVPTEGEIAIDGTPLQRLAVAPWRGRIAAVFQDFARFELRARDVVGVGDVARADDEEALAAALALAQADELVAGLPEGLDTLLGNHWGDGMDLSGGQWQRLAVARAMMRREPLLLVLDEPASALDAHAEDALLETYAAQARAARATTGAITLFISHRLSTARMADLIVVLRQGTVEAVGTHAELLARPGTYRELYELQRAAYAEDAPPPN